MSEFTVIVLEEFESSGLRCLVLVAPMGPPNGYVGVPKSHPLHGLHYDNEKIPEKLHSAVNGGLTFSGVWPGKKNKGLWFFGWDYSHYQNRGNAHDDAVKASRILSTVKP